MHAKEYLERQTVACLTPMVMLDKIIRGERIETSELLFPIYLFVELDSTTIHTTTIGATRGVSHFIHFGSLPVIIQSKSFKNCATIILAT